MARYIDIESVGIGKAKREQFLVPEYADGWNNAIEIFENEPAADVEEVKHGYWKQTEEPLGWKDVTCVECSACGESWVIEEDFSIDDYIEFWKYGPCCGAKMDKENAK